MWACLELLGASCFYGLVGWHCWSRRDCLSRLMGFLRSHRRASAEPPKAEEATSPLDRWVERQMDQFRIQSAQMLCEIYSVACAVMLASALLGLAAMDEDTKGRLAIMVGLTYPLCLASRHDGPIGLTRQSASLIYVAVNTVMIVVGHLLEPSDVFFLYYGGSFRTLIRSCSGCLVLDVYLSTAMNSIWSAVLIGQHLLAAPATHGAECRMEFVALEILTLVGMQSFICFADSFLRGHFRLNTSMVMATNLQEAVRKLLSVLCDAELQLQSDLSIWDPSPKVAQLLAPKKRPGELHCKPFTDYVAVADQERFKQFLSRSACSDAPASMHLQLCDDNGYRFPAELFVAKLPDIMDSKEAHLLGIKDCGQGKEASEAAAPQGPTFGPGCPPPPPVPAPKPPDAAETSSASSIDVQAMALPELRVELRFDPMDPEMPIQELRCIFTGPGGESPASAATTAAPAERLQPPLLETWFHEAFRGRLKDWVQENCNSFAMLEEGEGARYTSFGKPAVLQLPPRGDPTMLEAGTMDIDFVLEGEDEQDEEAEENVVRKGGGAENEEEEEGSSPEEDEDEGEGEAVVGLIRMGSFRQLLRRSKHRGLRSGAARSHRSHGSKRSDRSGKTGVPLQSIREGSGCD